MSSALMLVDVQQGMFALPSPLHRGEEVVRRIAELLERARAAGAPVVHVQHDGGPGHVLARGSAGWPHPTPVAPPAGEIGVEKRNSSAFHETDPPRRLGEAGIDRPVIARLATERGANSG